MEANTDQEIAPLNEDNVQPKDSAINIPEESLKPGRGCCIYKVPVRFRAGNEKAYTPDLISIGPIHHGNQNLTETQSQKLECYVEFSKTTSEETLTKLHGYVKEHLKRICRCYAVEFMYKLKASELIDIILHDAVFIIRLFLRDWKKKQGSISKDDNNHEEDDCYDFLKQRDDKEDDYLGFLNKNALSRVKLLTDLTLLENQLPFFVFEDLYEVAFLESEEPSFLHLACKYFGIKNDTSLAEKKIKHFTDLIRHQVLRACPLNTGTGNHNVHSATKLHEAGVKFQCTAVKDNCGVIFNGVSFNCFEIGGLEYEDIKFMNCFDVFKSLEWGLLEVQFTKGVLKLLTIDVEYETEIRFRNLMAFEQYYYPKEEAYFCSYIKLLDSLVNTSEDVDLLIKEGIIVNKLGSSEAVAIMINNLGVGVVHSTLLYGGIGQALNKHYKSSWNRRWTSLKHVYFNNPWRGTATVAASIVVMLTLIQTVLAILERAMPTK